MARKIAPADSVRSLSSRKSRRHQQSDLLRSRLSFNVTDLLAKGDKQTTGQGVDKLMTNKFLLREEGDMVTAPRAESNCCKSECTAARAGASGAAPRATCFLPGRKNTYVSLHHPEPSRYLVKAKKYKFWAATGWTHCACRCPSQQTYEYRIEENQLIR